MTLIGMDGCKAGWIAAESDSDLSNLRFVIHPDPAVPIRRIVLEKGLLVLDIPIGLAEREPRRCDVEARKLLGGKRGTSVFPAPCRATLAASTLKKGQDLNEAACGKKISAQLFQILPKIRQIDELISPASQEFVREAHPEVIFAFLSGGGSGIQESKKTERGYEIRRDLIRRYIPDFDAEAVARPYTKSQVARDDITDAAACLVAAWRVRRGEAVVLPDGDVPVDSRGLRMEMVS